MTLGRYTHDVTGCKAWKTALSSRICSMQLRPSFLEQADPKFAITARRKARLSVFCTWEEIIDNDRRFLAIEEKFDHVNACCIYFFRYKHLHDAFRELGQRAQGSQEIAITKLTLINVIGLDSILKYIGRLVYLTSTFPCERVI